MAKLIKIAESKDLTPGQGGVFEVEGKKIVVFNVDGNFYAIDDRFGQQEDSATIQQPEVPRHYTVTESGNDIQVEF